MHKKQIKKSNIFIHIPKTGGTTINCAMNNSEWQTTPDFNYRHIDYKTKRSNSADIFNPLKYELYEQHNIFMLLRHPIDRLLSEYSFIKTRPEFMNLIKPTPKDLLEIGICDRIIEEPNGGAHRDFEASFNSLKNVLYSRKIINGRPKNGPYPRFTIRRSGTIIDLFGVPVTCRDCRTYFCRQPATCSIRL